jgi:hypothetical protein
LEAVSKALEIDDELEGSRRHGRDQSRRVIEGEQGAGRSELDRITLWHMAKNQLRHQGRAEEYCRIERALSSILSRP